MPVEPMNDLDTAHAAFASLVATIAPADLALPTVNDGWTVRDVINHVIDGEYWAATYLRTGIDEFTDTDHAGNDPAAAVARGRQALRIALDERAHLERQGLAPGRSMATSDIVAIRIEELIGHGWDIAQATGQATDVAPLLAAKCLERARTRLSAPEARGEFFKPARQVSPDAPVADQLAAFLGKPVPAT